MPEKNITDLKEKVENDPFGIPGHQCIIDDMVKAVDEDREPAVSGEEGRKSLELVLSFYKSAKNNQLIQLAKEKEYVKN